MRKSSLYLPIGQRRNKSDARHSLSSLFHDVGVPVKMVMGGSKKQTLDEFKKNLRDADSLRPPD